MEAFKPHRILSLSLASFLIQCAAPAAGAVEAAPTGRILIRAGHVLDVHSGKETADQTIVVAGGIITGITATSATIKQPSDQEIDLLGLTVLPGLIDVHTHLTGENNFDPYRHLSTSVAKSALIGAANAKVTLEAGFTTVRNVGADDFVDVGLRNAINAGVTAGPRILTAVHAIGSPGGHVDDYAFPPERVKPYGPIEGVCTGPDQCREAVRYQMKWGADVIKIAASGGVLSESDPADVPQLTPEELSAIITEAHKWGRKVAAHCHGDAAARLAIAAGVDSIEHGSFLTEDTLKMMKAKGVWLVPTRMAVYWVNKQADTYPPKIAAKARAAAAAHDKMFRAALRIGVPIAFGTDSGVYPHGMNALEFSLMTDQGMAPAAALLAGTRDAAKLLGVQDIGTLEAGKVADIVAVPGNVLGDIHATEHPVFVMHLGRIVVQKAGS
jgi:imidazolonepropionase-like amidohydrolase